MKWCKVVFYLRRKAVFSEPFKIKVNVIVSVKKVKLKLFKALPINSLRKICRIERISSSGTKTELVERLTEEVSLKKTRDYSKSFGLKEGSSIFKHRLVPKHRIMKERERQELLKKYSITLDQLPRIRVRDPAAMAVGARVGDVLEITRKSYTAGKTKYYRVVIRKPIRR